MPSLFFSSRLAWPLLAFSSLAVTAAFAQTAASTNPAASAGQIAAITAVPPAFSSVFKSYKPFVEEKPADWRQANDDTARIGGWRAYAKEASEPNPASATPAAKQ